MNEYYDSNDQHDDDDDDNDDDDNDDKDDVDYEEEDYKDTLSTKGLFGGQKITLSYHEPFCGLRDTPISIYHPLRCP